MASKAIISKKTKDALVIIAIGIAVGLFYPLLSREYDDFGAMLNGLLVGLIGSGFIVLNEIVYRKFMVRKMRFSSLVIFKSLVYTTFFVVTIVLVVSFTRALNRGVSLPAYLGSAEFNRFIWQEDFHIIVFYALGATTVFIFTYQMSRKMGQGVLWSFITGRYHQPREEERVFMFLDLTNSTTIAEKLGDVEYNKLLSDFFFDITESILSNYGKIYRYVGDEVVVSWSLNRGIANARFIRSFFAARQAIQGKAADYQAKYNLVPSFTAGFHYGKVIVGEIGEVKSQICFIGDVMYETTSIEKHCKTFMVDNLISEQLVDLVEWPESIALEQQGPVAVAGMANITVYSATQLG